MKLFVSLKYKASSKIQIYYLEDNALELTK